MKYTKYIPYAIIAILLVILFTRETKEVVITIPEKTGTFQRDSTELEPIIKYDTIIKKGEPEIVVKENPVNQDLLKKYELATDSLEQLSLYKEAVTEKTYKEVYQDSTQRITVESEVIGTLKSQKVDYKIFEQKVTAKVKQPKFRVYAGAETTTKLIQTITPKLYVVHPKYIVSGGYNIQLKQYQVGVAVKLF